MVLVEKQMRNNILRLAWPVILEMSWVMGVTVLVTAMIGRLGAVPLAAVGLAAMVQFSTAMIFAAAGTGAAAIIARSAGAEDWTDVRLVAGQALLLGLAAGVILAVSGYYAAPVVFSLVGAEAEVSHLASDLIKIAFVFTPLYLIMAVGNAILRGLGKTKRAFYITSVSNTAALVVSYILIYGQGVPALGAYGAPWGIGTSQAIGGILAGTALMTDKRIGLRWRDVSTLDTGIMKRILAISVPAGFEQLSMQGGRMAYTFMLANVGAVQFAAHQIAVQVESLSFMPGFGFSVAVMTLVGQNMGRKLPEQAAQYAWATHRLAFGSMTFMGVIFFVFAKPLTALFINDAGVIAWGSLCVMIAALEQPTIAITYVLGGALRGAGDTRWPMYITTIGVWLVRVPLIYLFIVIWHYDITAAWLITAGDFFVRSIILWWRFSANKWKTITL